MKGYQIAPHHLAPPGINQLAYDVLNVLWQQHRYVSNFFIHTMRW